MADEDDERDPDWCHTHKQIEPHPKPEDEEEK